VNSHLTEEFVKCFEKLPNDVKAKARKNYKLWRENTSHPSLHFKQVRGKEAVYSVRVGLGWRALGLLEGDTITWFWIGSHADYETLVS
jgi:hypothetical protein